MYSWRVWVKLYLYRFQIGKATSGELCLLLLVPLISNELFNSFYSMDEFYNFKEYGTF